MQKERSDCEHPSPHPPRSAPRPTLRHESNRDAPYTDYYNFEMEESGRSDWSIPVATRHLQKGNLVLREKALLYLPRVSQCRVHPAELLTCPVVKQEQPQQQHKTTTDGQQDKQSSRTTGAGQFHSTGVTGSCNYLSRCNNLSCLKIVSIVDHAPPSARKNGMVCPGCRYAIFCDSECYEVARVQYHQKICNKDLLDTQLSVVALYFALGLPPIEWNWPAPKMLEKVQPIISGYVEALRHRFPKVPIVQLIDVCKRIYFRHVDHRTFVSFHLIGSAFSPVTASFPHSCDPNCYMYISGADRIEIRAMDDIQEGTPLTICYDDDLLFVEHESRRDALLEHFGHECNCPRCNLSLARVRDFLLFTHKGPRGTVKETLHQQEQQQQHHRDQQLMSSGRQPQQSDSAAKKQQKKNKSHTKKKNSGSKPGNSNNNQPHDGISTRHTSMSSSGGDKNNNSSSADRARSLRLLQQQKSSQQSTADGGRKTNETRSQELRKKCKFLMAMKSMHRQSKSCRELFKDALVTDITPQQEDAFLSDEPFLVTADSCSSATQEDEPRSTETNVLTDPSVSLLTRKALAEISLEEKDVNNIDMMMLWVNTQLEQTFSPTHAVTHQVYCKYAGFLWDKSFIPEALYLARRLKRSIEMWKEANVNVDKLEAWSDVFFCLCVSYLCMPNANWHYTANEQVKYKPGHVPVTLEESDDVDSIMLQCSRAVQQWYGGDWGIVELEAYCVPPFDRLTQVIDSVGMAAYRLLNCIDPFQDIPVLDPLLSDD